jgi:branched-chain amino acid transport system permease protein
VLGAVALGFLNHWFIPDVLDGESVRDKLDSLGLAFSFTEVTFGVFGFLLVLMMALRPEGLLPERRRQMEMKAGEGPLDDPQAAVFEARV